MLYFMVNLYSARRAQWRVVAGGGWYGGPKNTQAAVDFILSMRAKYAYFKWREAEIGLEIRLKIRAKSD